VICFAHNAVRPDAPAVPQSPASSKSTKTTPSLSNPHGLTINTPPRELAGRRSSIMKSLIQPVMGMIPAIGKGRSSRRQRDGLIASPRPPASPAGSAPGSPMNFWGNENPTFPTSPHLSPNAVFGGRPVGNGNSGSPTVGMGRPPPKRAVTVMGSEMAGRSFTPPPYMEHLKASQNGDTMVRRVVSSSNLADEDTRAFETPVKSGSKGD
jgi:hypothetical protein